MQRSQKPPTMGRSAVLTGAAQALGRVTGLLRDVVFAGVFGATGTADAFFVAFRIPNLFRELLAEGTLSNVFIPLFAETREREGKERAWALANALLGLLLALLGVITAVIFFASEPMVLLVAKGFEADPGKFALAAWLTRLLAPFLAGISVAALFGGMLNVSGRFFLPAVAPAALNVAIIIACLAGDTWEGLTDTPAIGAVAVAATLSGLITAAIQLPALHRAGFRLRPNLGRHPAMGKVIKTISAALIGVGVVQFNLLVELQLASREGDGAISWLMMGFRLIQVPMSVIAGSIAVASLARVSLQWAQDDKDGVRDSLSSALESTFLFVIPAAAGLYMLADPLVALCFERGSFTSADTAATAEILRGYAIAATGICAARVLLPAFFALKDPYLPMRLSLVVLVIKIPVALFLMDLFGLIGLPLSHAVTVSLEVIVMMWVLHFRLSGWRDGFWGELLKVVACTAMMCIGLSVAMHMMPVSGDGSAVLLCGAGTVLFGIFGALFRIRSLGTIKNALRRRLYPPDLAQ